ncbi:hypothetical protein ZWY2020_005619 [Hordeum vulgare]|nr:hypothetical protein ZWY2020_005619 [Hordeum vulgare]
MPRFFFPPLLKIPPKTTAPICRPRPQFTSHPPDGATASGESRHATAPVRRRARNFPALHTARARRSPPHPPPTCCLKFPTTNHYGNQQATASSAAIVSEISHHCVLRESAGHRLICRHHAWIVMRTDYRVLV